MNFYDKGLDQIIDFVNSDKNLGLNKEAQSKNIQKFGKNLLTKQKKSLLF